MTTNIPDELLSAYVDGELEGTDRARVEQAIALDARLAQRVARHRALRARLRKAFDRALDEPVPQRLVNAAKLPLASGPAQIIDLARVRASRVRRPEKRRAALPRRATIAVAASLLVGLGAGLLIEAVITGTGLTAYRGGSLLASGSLNRALNDQLAITAPVSGAVRIGLSFRAKTGGYCRTFVIDNTRALAGLACREQQQWRILTLLGTDAAGSHGSAQAYRMASSAMPPALLQAVNEHISGEPLDAAAEAKARRGGWN
jgi:hypothetical protein